MIDISNPKVKTALNAVRQAAILMRQIQRETVVSSLTKDDKSPVTVADFTTQAIIGRFLSQAFPDIPLVAEETSAALREPDEKETLTKVTQYVSKVIPDATSDAVCEWIDYGGAEPGEQFWVLDPIDGTKGFLRGDQYAVALALVEDGVVQIGVLGCPNLREARIPDMEGQGSLVLAVRGQGTWTTSMAEGDEQWEQLNVSKRNDSTQARLLRSFESGHTNVSQIDELADWLGVEVDPVRMDSQAKYAVLAAGGGEVIVRLLSPKRPDYREKIWDQAAGSIILEEAGGKLTDLSGKPLDFTQGRLLTNNRGVLATNGFLHEKVLQGLVAVRA
ncbi:MAG: 3'(2'),5'-bisphosphate nucleotidase [Anaerolineales bacterium]